jgi:hypothetical protein
VCILRSILGGTIIAYVTRVVSVFVRFRAPLRPEGQRNAFGARQNHKKLKKVLDYSMSKSLK